MFESVRRGVYFNEEHNNKVISIDDVRKTTPSKIL